MDFGEDTGSPVLEDYADKMPHRSVGFFNNLIVSHEISVICESSDGALISRNPDSE